ncbi:adenylate kinase [Actinoplanes sp. DH11]|uniref:adenylate kinase n=1 Tax=Actinoplanes sp. DH11 TaxID=2857011 RepID=UPI001E481384|nr:adenylate kinase [Actinoplanes sp. DH11]
MDISVILTGAPGSGKGTQASTLARRRNLAHLSTGDLFREHITRGTDLGRAARRHLDAGRYVPDELTNAMVRDHIERVAPDGGIILDGYPRTRAQVDFLDGLLSGLVVLNLVVEPAELLRRLAHRATVGGRSDDAAEVVRERLALYAVECEPVLGAYRERGLLFDLDGAGEPHAVAARIDEALAALPAARS